ARERELSKLASAGAAASDEHARALAARTRELDRREAAVARLEREGADAATAGEERERTLGAREAKLETREREPALIRQGLDAAWPALKPLLGLWRTRWRLGALGLVCAFAYTLISITVPILVARAIDHAIVRRTQPLWPYVAAIVSLAAVRFGINFTRRYAT